MIAESTLPSLQDADSAEAVPAGVNDISSIRTASDQTVDHYRLEEQIGYLLRLANQRHLEIFAAVMPSLTPTQFAVLARLYQEGSSSQNELGRRVGIDAATTNGVIERLARKKLISARTDSSDKRRLLIALTPAGKSAIAQSIPVAQEITRQTLVPLNDNEATQLIQLLKKLQKP